MKHYAYKQNSQKFKVDDIVHSPNLKPASGTNRKLKNKFKGPLRVIKSLPNDRYVLVLNITIKRECSKV